MTPPSNRRPRITLFDLDHTLLPLDSDYEWGEFTIRLGWVERATFGARNQAFYAAYVAGTLDVHEYVRFATEAFCRQGEQAALAAQAQFMREVIAPALHPQAIQLLAQHRQRGDELVIVTATNEFVTRPIAHALGVAQLLAVELERTANGWYSGEIHGIPSIREGKVQRVQDWLAARQLDWADVESTFYSDSSNDLPLLEKVDHPVACNPDTRLRAVAVERGWPVLEIFHDLRKKG